MSIEKKINPIELICEPDGVNGEVYNVVYYPEGIDQNANSPDNSCIVYIKKDDENSYIGYPISLLTEIVDFLRKDGFLKDKKTNQKNLDFNNNIIDKIQAQPEDNNRVFLPLPNVQPISSFENNNETYDSQINILASGAVSENEDNILAEKEIEENNVGDSGSAIKIGKNDKKDFSNIKKRPVIRTRVDDEQEDPLKAEREANLQRSALSKGNTTIKRKE